MSEAKPYCISKWEVWEAYKRVKANQGAAGVDEQTIEEFDKDLKGNLYKIWNRMSSGSYFPPAVRTVKIPKADGGNDQCVKKIEKPGVEKYPLIAPYPRKERKERGQQHREALVYRVLRNKREMSP